MIILGKISNPSELTIYSIASKIFQIYITLCGVISSMLLPRYMALVKEKKTTVIMVTHDETLATLCDRKVVIKDGVIEN